MASRRKSAKPTNKLRQVQIEDDEEDSHIAENTRKEMVSQSQIPLRLTYCKEVTKIESSEASFSGPQVHFSNTASMQPQDYRPIVINGALLDEEKTQSQCEAVDPILELPSDVYNDFEALRSTTKLDSPEMMRRLLKYYNKLTNSTMTREKKLDNVIEGIRGRSINTSTEHTSSTPAAVLDLSVHKKKAEPIITTQHQQPYSADDVISVDDLSALSNPGSPLRPLDLTLQKPEPVSVVTKDILNPVEYSRMTNGSASFLFSTCFQAPTDSSYFYTSSELKQAAPYVINLESPTTTAEMSSLTQQPDKLSDASSFTPQASRLINLGALPYLHSHEDIASAIIAGSRNTSGVPAVTQPRQTYTTPTYAPSALFAMSKTSLPSYSEAINSTLHSKQGLVTSITSPTTSSTNVTTTNDTNNNREWTGSTTFLDSTSHLINSDGRHISVLQIRPDFHTIKNLQPHLTTTPENFLFDGSDQKESRPQGIYSTPNNFLLTDTVPFLSPKSIPFNSPQTSSLFSENSKFKLQADAPVSSNNNNEHKLRNQSPHTDSHSNPMTSPLPSPVTLTGSVLMPSLAPSTAAASQMYSHATMSLPTVFMSQTSDGSVSNVVAIPVLQGLPEGYTNLQHFTFEPSSSSLPVKSEIATVSPSSLQYIQSLKAPAATATNDNFILQKVCAMSNTTTSFPVAAGVKTSQIYVNSIPSESKKEWVKMRPGRPKGKTGKVSAAKKTQNKDMKLLTENSLFPGVYTSILKLPWSKRTRNKSKAKTDAETKKCRTEVLEESIEHKVVDAHEGKELTVSSGCSQSELLQNAGVLMSESAMEISSDMKEENTFPLQVQHAGQQNHELEQQRRLHYQYQARLREEQHKMQNELEDTVTIHQIPCTSPDTVISPSPDNPYSAMNIKSELCDNSEVQSEIRHNVMLSSASIAAGHDQNVPNSQDPIMLIYPNIGPNGSKSKKRRGRPPKKPMGELKGHQDSFLFPVDSIFYPSDSIPDSSFIHGNNPNLTFIPTVSSSLNQDLSLMSSLPSSFTSSEKSGTDTMKIQPSSSSDYQNLHENEETSLEHKIIFLTNQIEMEMVRGNRQQAKELNPSSDMKAGQDLESGSQIVTKSTEKPVQGAKTRRKKTSRMLKSNENFIYATFRFKPRGGGSGGKKVKKKKRTNATSLTANAETIANLRNKKLKCSESFTKQGKDPTKTDPCVVQSWKFHEQYPCTSGRSKGNNPMPVVSVMPCLSCGMSFLKPEDASNNEQICNSCISHQHNRFQEQDGGMDTIVHYNTQFKTESEICDNSFLVEKERDTMTSCISCDKKFEKSFSDSSSQCDACRRNIQSLISSSKLFSISNTADLPTASPAIPNSLTPQFKQTPENKTIISLPNSINPLTTGNILFCSLCRMQFTQISEYLLHIKETHESTTTSSAEYVSSLQASSTDNSTDSAHRKVRSTLKTKKSLAHKTITCPVEDCPLFFRHKRDMDHHLRKVHGSNTNTADGCANTPGSNSNQVDKGQLPIVDELPSPPFSLSSNDNSLALTLEENESSATSNPQNEKPLCCSFCNFRCRQKNAMTWHMRKHPEAASQHRRYSNVSSE